MEIPPMPTFCKKRGALPEEVIREEELFATLAAPLNLTDCIAHEHWGRSALVAVAAASRRSASCAGGSAREGGNRVVAGSHRRSAASPRHRRARARHARRSQSAGDVGGNPQWARR